MSSDRFQQDSSGNVYIPIPTGKKAYLAYTDGGQPVLGNPGVVATHVSIGNTAAVTNAINYTPPAVSNKIYRLSVYIDVTAWTTPSNGNVTYTYTDASGNAKSAHCWLSRDDDTNSYLWNAAKVFEGLPVLFTIDNSGTAITLSTAGTITGSPVYNLAAILERMN